MLKLITKLQCLNKCLQRIDWSILIIGALRYYKYLRSINLFVPQNLYFIGRKGLRHFLVLFRRVKSRE